MIFHCVSMDCVEWLWVAILCSWLVRAFATSCMARKVLNDLEGESDTAGDGLLGKFLCVYGLFSQYSPFWPYLWQDRRTLGKERPLALLWSEL